MKAMKTISLFSGCGGLDFGAEQAGADIVFSNDIDADSCATLRKYFPKTEVINDDIANIKNFPRADLVIGGYPCQSFSIGGNRKPGNDARTFLYQHFARCLDYVNPKYFVAENVDGLQKLRKGKFLKQQIDLFQETGKEGYEINYARLDAKEYGVPQTRKRLFIIGVRKDIGRIFEFPLKTHGKKSNKFPHLKPYSSHGEYIRLLPLNPKGEYYERPHDPEGNFSWYYMSRNRKKPWSDPSYTIVANWRHITLHPASPTMRLVWSNLSDGWKQKWEFTDEYEHIVDDPNKPILDKPRRLSWRECACIQTFPNNFEPEGKVESKFNQIGNAVPVDLARIVIFHLISKKGLVNKRYVDTDKLKEMQFPLL